jgi:hypothetical protein
VAKAKAKAKVTAEGRLKRRPTEAKNVWPAAMA